MAGSESFPRTLRLTRSKEFQQVFQNNRRFRDAYLTILVGNKTGETPRLGFAIAKKQVPLAVKRHNIKRLVRESFRRQQQTLPARDMVILVRKEIVKLDNAAITALLEKQWTRITNHAKNPDPAHSSLSIPDQPTPAT